MQAHQPGHQAQAEGQERAPPLEGLPRTGQAVMRNCYVVVKQHNDVPIRVIRELEKVKRFCAKWLDKNPHSPAPRITHSSLQTREKRGWRQIQPQVALVLSCCESLLVNLCSSTFPARETIYGRGRIDRVRRRGLSARQARVGGSSYRI